jgi:hypothetical protein
VVVVVKSTLQGEEGTTHVTMAIAISTTNDDQGRTAALAHHPMNPITTIAMQGVRQAVVEAKAVTEAVERPAGVVMNALIAHVDDRAPQAARQVQAATQA